MQKEDTMEQNRGIDASKPTFLIDAEGTLFQRRSTGFSNPLLEDVFFLGNPGRDKENAEKQLSLIAEKYGQTELLGIVKNILAKKGVTNHFAVCDVFCEELLTTLIESHKTGIKEIDEKEGPGRESLVSIRVKAEKEAKRIAAPEYIKGLEGNANVILFTKASPFQEIAYKEMLEEAGLGFVRVVLSNKTPKDKSDTYSTIMKFIEIADYTERMQRPSLYEIISGKPDPDKQQLKPITPKLILVDDTGANVTAAIEGGAHGVKFDYTIPKTDGGLGETIEKGSK